MYLIPVFFRIFFSIRSQLLSFFFDAAKCSRYLFLCLIFTLLPIIFSCGTSDDSGKGDGSYAVKLKFPDMPRSATENDRIDCDAAGIETINCALFSAEGTLIKSVGWSCSQSKGTISDIPSGSGITMVVTADGINKVTRYRGEEDGIVIKPGVTTRGEIEMNPFDPATDTQTETDIDSGTDTDMETDTETETDTQTDTETETDTQTDTETDTDTQTDPETDTDTQTDTETTTQTDTSTDTNTDNSTGENRFTIQELSMTFVRIQAGEFHMGSLTGEPGRFPDETRHLVRITRPFYMQTTEVTQRQWRIVAEESDDANLRDIARPSSFVDCGDNCPVERVNWNDVQRYIRALNQRYPGLYFRLPFEAEWEYAARAGTDSAFASGPMLSDPDDCDFDANLDSMGWYCHNSNGMPHPVAHQSKEPNRWGLYDMHGNVFEWCFDYYGDYPPGPVSDPEGPEAGNDRVLRGGSWYSDSTQCRSALRHFYSTISRSSVFGFRLVCFQRNR